MHCDIAVRKRKAEPFLSQESGHTETLEWLTSFLDNDCYNAAINQLEKANAGRIDGEILFSIAEKEVSKEGYMMIICDIAPLIDWDPRKFPCNHFLPGVAYRVWTRRHYIQKGLDEASGA